MATWDVLLPASSQTPKALHSSTAVDKGLGPNQQTYHAKHAETLRCSNAHRQSTVSTTPTHIQAPPGPPPLCCHPQPLLGLQQQYQQYQQCQQQRNGGARARHGTQSREALHTLPRKKIVSPNPCMQEACVCQAPQLQAPPCPAPMWVHGHVASCSSTGSLAHAVRRTQVSPCVTRSSAKPR